MGEPDCEALFNIAKEMHMAIANPQAARAPASTQIFPSLEAETRTAVNTETAAFHLCREPQTLRLWACKQSGPIQPLRVHGRLAWPIADIRRLLGLAA